jgi:two-component system phosphate regulon sensor histidine kinase PhoR
MLNALSDGIVLTEADGRITFWNTPALLLLGFEANESFGERRINDIFWERFPDQADELDVKLSKPLPVLVMELKKGTELSQGILRLSRTRIVRGKAEAVWLWSFRDVTQQKLVDEMRNQFVFSATHELRTPLTNLKALAETLVLSEQISVEDQKQFCNMINSEATRLSRFVDELLNLSQMESGAMSIVRTETDMERLLAEVIENVQPEIDRKHIAFNARLPAKLPKLQIDKDKIIAAIVNLLGNAVKYTPEEGRVDFLVKTDESRMLIEVEDSGYGISPEDLPRIFDKFFRSDDERVRKETGTGLGLAFTREVIQIHGGHITATSELGKGSRFSVSLPIWN